ncbi:MAG: acyl-CoA dehydrogenase family protein [Pseudomonadota bacterium]
MASAPDISDRLGRMGLSEEQADLMRVAAEFCREQSPPERVRTLIDDERGYDPAVWRQIGELGWCGIATPEEHGGAGLNLAEIVPVAEHMGRTMMATPFLVSTLAAEAILAGGTDAQKSHWLPRLAAGEIVGTLALGEAGDQMTALGTAEDGGAMVSGRATLIEHAAAADIIVLAFTQSGTARLAILETERLPEGALRRERIIDDTRRAYELTLRTFELPAANLMPAETVTAARERVELAGALLHAADMVGGAFRVIDYTADYLRTRTQFGKQIGSYQALKHPLVDAFVGYEKARSHLYAAAHSYGSASGRPGARNDMSGEIAVRMAKAQAERAYAFAADRAIQFHGGFGFTYDCDAGLHRRRALWNASRHGDARAQKKKLAKLLF